MPDPTLPASPGVADIAFGKCVVLVSQRQLMRDGLAVELGDRAFELLLALIDGHGGCVSKDQLMARVWPGRIVEENTIEGRMSLLRRALGEDRSAIRTIAGRGYQFVAQPRRIGTPAAPALAPVAAVDMMATVATATATAATAPALAPPGNRLPASVSRLIGRDVALGEITELALSNRLITLVGTGGIGKTRLAVEAARRLADSFRDGAYLAELGAVVSADFVAITVAAALGLPGGDDMAALERIAALARSRQLLLVLDNCEHLIGAAALLVERLLRAAPDACIIATSREALRIEGEYVYRVASLEVPDGDGDDAQLLTGSGALQLFQARLGPGPQATGAALALQARICRRLDGIPLALELAAARVAVFGLQGVAERLDDRFDWLTNGARTALPRQQTLRATLDWSYELLPDDERAVLGRLGIFAGAFTLASALAIAATAEQPAATVAACVASLAEKSLLALLPGEPALRYRLLETTRVYAREKLGAGGAAPGQALARAHALHYLALFEACAREAEQDAGPAWSGHYAPHLEDFRAAVGWCFGATGAAELGVRLTLAAMPLSLQLGLLEECIARLDQALAWLERDGAAAGACHMQLYAARGATLLYRGASAAAGAAFHQALAIADRLGDAAYQKYGVWGSCATPT